MLFPCPDRQSTNMNHFVHFKHYNSLDLVFIFSDCLFVTSQVLFLVLNFINCDFLISRDSLFSETYIRRARDSGSFQSAGITVLF